jgi:hypothetical protein
MEIYKTEYRKTEDRYKRSIYRKSGKMKTVTGCPTSSNANG